MRPIKSLVTIIAIAMLVGGCSSVVPTESASHSPVSAVPSASATPAVTPSDWVAPALSILSVDELLALTNDPSARGQIVLSDPPFSSQPPEEPTESPVTRVVGYVASRDGRSAPIVGLVLPDLSVSVHAFAIGFNELDYLGPVVLRDHGAWPVAPLLTKASADSADHLYPVEGWLTQTLALPCRAPPDFSSPQDYWCGGSYLAGEEPSSTALSNGQSSIAGAMHVQWSAYHGFVVETHIRNAGGEPRFGTYLVQPAGCPANVMGDCPVWEMVGRLDPRTETSPAPTATFDLQQYLQKDERDRENGIGRSGVIVHDGPIPTDEPGFAPTPCDPDTQPDYCE